MHRHNVGFMALDVIAEMHGFGPVQKKFQGWLQEGRVAGSASCCSSRRRS
jgi:PTH1 family peptidyl-tRNA hydrolase